MAAYDISVIYEYIRSVSPTRTPTFAVAPQAAETLLLPIYLCIPLTLKLLLALNILVKIEREIVLVTKQNIISNSLHVLVSVR